MRRLSHSKFMDNQNNNKWLSAYIYMFIYWLTASIVTILTLYLWLHSTSNELCLKYSETCLDNIVQFWNISLLCIVELSFAKGDQYHLNHSTASLTPLIIKMSRVLLDIIHNPLHYTDTFDSPNRLYTAEKSAIDEQKHIATYKKSLCVNLFFLCG